MQEELAEAKKDQQTRKFIMTGSGSFPERVYTGTVKSVDNINFVIIDKYKNKVILSISNIKRVDRVRDYDWQKHL